MNKKKNHRITDYNGKRHFTTVSPFCILYVLCDFYVFRKCSGRSDASPCWKIGWLIAKQWSLKNFVDFSRFRVKYPRTFYYINVFGRFFRRHFRTKYKHAIHKTQLYNTHLHLMYVFKRIQNINVSRRSFSLKARKIILPSSYILVLTFTRRVTVLTCKIINIYLVCYFIVRRIPKVFVRLNVLY